jgi:hypothetical protein
MVVVSKLRRIKKKGETMSTFEYKVVKEQRHLEIVPPKVVDWKPAETLLKNMSEDGWELVSVIAYPELGNGAAQWKEYYFKRPISK